MGHEGHDHLHEHEHAHEHSHEHAHPHDHAQLHDAQQPHDHAHEASPISPKDELVALMKYMVGHNAAHIDELADLAQQLNTIGESAAYDRILRAVELFRQGNADLEEVLKALA